MKKYNFLKKLIFFWLVLSFNIFDSFCVMNGDSEYEDVEIEGRVTPGKLIKAGMISYTADDVVAYAFKVTLKDIPDLETEQGKKYLATPEGKEKFLESVKAYLSGYTALLGRFSSEMKDLVQDPDQINQDNIDEYIFFTSQLFQIDRINTMDGKNRINNKIDYYNIFTEKFNRNEIDLKCYYQILGIENGASFSGLHDGYNFTNWNFNDISINYNKSILLHMANGKF